MLFNRVTAAAAFCGALLVAGNASADSVSFNVEFDFNPSTAAVDGTLNLGGGAYLSLDGVTNTGVDAPLETTFGVLGFDPKDSLGTIPFEDRQFLMKITVTDPTSEFGTMTASYEGSINSKGTSGTIIGGSVDVAGFRFTLNDLDFSLNARQHTELLTGTVDVLSGAHAVPLPAAVWGGASLLALLGGKKWWSRRQLD